jgi:hypothetical protein
MSNEKIICITHDFANTRLPKLMTAQQVEEYNNTVKRGYIEISQNHSGLKKKAKTQIDLTSSAFFGLKNKSNSPTGLYENRHAIGYS